ncbi:MULTISPECIES: hypothetical protein [Antrihabitans]|uniref:Uncharacterized protein n=2 Tax=Antrihabitans TaxID=2799491 RepID=A0A934NU30_9NOCA|nr:hypothetical protein [Antrihabitans stalagmiti]MBJ8341436.1 hypothetical protein [Antrihabitans stalagmiti]
MRLTGAQALKLAGLAGAVGVVATGVVVARNERARRAYTPDEVREQLHARYARAASAPTTIAQPSKPTLRERVSFLRRKKSRA